MNTIRTFTAAALAFCAFTAHAAEVQYSASMLMPDGLPKLLTGSPAWDGPQSLAGQWTNVGRPDTFINTREVTGHDAGTGAPTFGAWTGYDGGKHKAGPMNSMMEASGHRPSLDGNVSAHAEVFWDRMSATTTVTDGGAEADTRALWNRNFSIDPLTTFTFSALSTLSILGDASPFATTSTFGLDTAASFASMTMADATGAVRNTLGAAISSVLPADLGGVFGFSFGPNGLMSLTITNTTNAAMTGTLSAGSYINVTAAALSSPAVAAPVPEPEAILSMLAGLGLVGATVARRRRRRRAEGAAA